jgi:hypothetical protein
MSEIKNNIGFGLRKVTTEQFAIIESSFEEGKPIELKAGLRFGINNENKIISTFFSTNLIQEKAPFLLLVVGCHFNITEDAWLSFLNEDKSEIVIPKGFISHLVMLTIGTARGVLHSKTENTPFNLFLLPTLNVNDLVQKEVIFKLSKEAT